MTDADLKMFAARTQARITTQLLSLFGGLMFALLVLSFLPSVHEDKDMLAILDRIITAMLPIVGGAVGFWMSRSRDNGATPSPDTTTSTTISTTTPTTPVTPAT